MIRSAFMETETKDLAMRSLQHYYKEMLKHPSAKPMELATLCEIMSKEVNKGHAVRLLCAHYGLSTSQAIAFGDGPNDIDMLNAQEAPTVVDVTDYWQAPGDSMGTATVEVTDYLQKKAIEGGMQLIEEATFQLTVVEREGVYYVRMEGLPRSGTQSRGSAGDE